MREIIKNRVRAIGHPVPRSHGQFGGHISVTEESGVPAAQEMIAQRAKDREIVERAVHDVLPVVDEAATNQPPTC